MQTYLSHLQRIGQKPPGPGTACLDFRSQYWLPDDKEASILEIGCGMGNRLYALHRMGFTRLTGVDQDPEVAGVARRHLPAEIDIACIEARRFLGEVQQQYDRVLLFHLLEHLDGEAGIDLLRLVRDHLAPGGQVVVEVPNMTSLTGAHMFHSDITHRTAYTEYSMSQVFTEAGYEYIRLICPTLRLELRQWRPWHPFRGTTLGWRASRLMHRLIYRITGMSPPPHCFCAVLLMVAARRPPG